VSILVVVLLLLVQGCAMSALETLTPGAPEPSVEATLVVDPRGQAGSNCRPAAPCTTIARAAEVARAGDVVVIRPGTYAGDVIVRGAGTAQRPIVFTAERPGTVIVRGHVRPLNAPSSGGQDNTGGYTAHAFVTLRGLTIRNHPDGVGTSTGCAIGTAAVMAHQGWRIEDSLIEGGQSGVRVGGNDVVIDSTTFQDLARYAFLGANMSRTIIRDSVIRRINTAGTINPACGSVTKFLFTDGLVFEGNQSYENVGPGFWLDWDNKNYVVRNNVLRNNRGRTNDWEGPGLWIEGNPASNGKVYGNTFANNTGAGLGILESVGVEVYGNTFAGNAPGIELRNIPRGAERVLRDIDIHDNTFKSWRNAAIGASAGCWAGWFPAAFEIVITRNAFGSLRNRVVFTSEDTSDCRVSRVRQLLDRPYLARRWPTVEPTMQGDRWR
jgi:hypothetical protein